VEHIAMPPYNGQSSTGVYTANAAIPARVLGFYFGFYIEYDHLHNSRNKGYGWGLRRYRPLLEEKVPPPLYFTRAHISEDFNAT